MNGDFERPKRRQLKLFCATMQRIIIIIMGNNTRNFG